MKTNHKISALFLLLFLAMGLSQQTFAQPGVNMSRQDFYDELSPYGDWMDNPSYGQVWRPNVDAGFQPYATDGRWEMTEYGNTWVSDYPWGWAPFHYGRWLFDDYNGWIWIPDYEWGPAWVSWRSGGGYYGWAPLGPGMNIGMNINIPYNYWVFVPDIYIRSPRVFGYCVPRNRIGSIFGGTTYITNYYRYNNRAYAYGPNRYDIERITRSRVNVYRADDLHRQNRYGQQNRTGNYGQNYARRDGYSRPDNNDRRGNNNAPPNYNGRDRGYSNDNTRNNSGQRSEGNNGNRVPQSGRRDGDVNPSERAQQPQNTTPQPNRPQERPYQAPERGNAQRTWGDNGGTTAPSQNNRGRSSENSPSTPRGTNGEVNRQPRANQESAPQRAEGQSERRSNERSNDTPQGQGRRRGPQ